MKTLVTGATGYQGTPLILALIKQGTQVKGLIRSEAKCQPALKHPQIELVKGDVTDPGSLQRAVRGCNEVYHLAAFAGIWTKDSSLYHRINVEGTRDLLDAAVKEGVRRIVITSTAGVMGPAIEGEVPVNEHTFDKPPLFSKYDQSKFEQEKMAFSFQRKGIEVVVVNPSRIYGPGIKGVSNSVSRLIEMFNQGQWRFIPGQGRSQGNYVYIDDVIRGHLLAMRHGISGQRYILGGPNISYNDLFALLNRLTKRNLKLFKVPVKVLLLWSYLEIFRAYFTDKTPMVVPDFVEKLTHNWSLSSDKAIKELGYSYLDLETGIKRTLDWINHV